jgi:hypothetical protein
MGCDPNGVSKAGLPSVVWQATQMPFHAPVSEKAACPGGCITAARLGIQRRSSTSQIAGS